MIRQDPGRILWVPTPYQEVDLKSVSHFEGARIASFSIDVLALADPFFGRGRGQGSYRESLERRKEESGQVAVAWGKRLNGQSTLFGNRV